ncbi:MAG: hypothetical protein QNJ17_07050, partial [Desulfocapsaceae bacterium]|nr:hypothetical protein [Desulfocapsaceae bacterium]
MNIVVLDGYTLNPGDLNWQKLEVFGNLQIYDRTPADQVISRAKSAEAVFTNKTVLSADTLKSLPNIKYIGVLATGYDVIDTKAASSLGITVTNVPGYGPDSVAQMVFSHILHFTNNVADDTQYLVFQFNLWTEPVAIVGGFAPATLDDILVMSGYIVGKMKNMTKNHLCYRVWSIAWNIGNGDTKA